MQRIMSISNSAGRFSTFSHVLPFSISSGMILMARGGQINSHNWQDTHMITTIIFWLTITMGLAYAAYLRGQLRKR